MKHHLALLATLVFCLLQSSVAGAQSVQSIFTNLPADFAHLFTPSNAIVLGIGGGASAAIHPKDEEIADRIQATTGARVTFFKAGDALGQGGTHAAIALGAFIIGRASHRTGLAQFGVDVLDAQIVNGVLTQGLKFAVDRRRPNGSRHSFPSGHVSATFASAAVIQEHYGWKVAAPFYALGGYVGVARMVDHEHYASDIIFGAALGAISGRAASFGHGPHRVQVSPQLTPGVVAILGTIGK